MLGYWAHARFLGPALRTSAAELFRKRDIFLGGGIYMICCKRRLARSRVTSRRVPDI